MVFSAKMDTQIPDPSAPELVELNVITKESPLIIIMTTQT